MPNGNTKKKQNFNKLFFLARNVENCFWPLPSVAINPKRVKSRTMRTLCTARTRSRWTRWLPWRLLLALNCLCLVAHAGSLEFDFDGPETSWQVRCRQREATLEAQERRREGARRGQAEYFRIRASVERTPLRIEHDIPLSQVLDEFTASVWFRSDRPGATLAVRIAFRDQVDPDTATPVTMLIIGDRYEDAGKWQLLKCQTTDKAVNDQLRLLRAMKKVGVDRSSMVIDRVLVGNQLDTGATEIWIDHMEVGPIVPAANTPEPIQLTRADEPPKFEAAPTGPVPVEFRLHKLRVSGKPFLPRIIPHRQERPDVLAEAGANVAWVPDLEALSNTGQFRDRGVWLTATPPFAKGSDDQPLDSEDASLLPFGPSSSSVLFWTLGVRMTATGRPRLPSWANQVRDADRSFRRPLAADMADDERIASRHLDLVGLSRHVLNSGLTLTEFRDEILRRRDRAWPGTCCFTWIQTEPAPELLELAAQAGAMPVLEPEQIRLQVYAALAAGCRGIGYWTTTPLDAELPGARERQLMLTQLNLELSLLEPWLATGSGGQLISFTVEPQAGAKAKASVEATRDAERELKAALIRSEHGALVLPMWLENHSQFVPGSLSSNTATIVVPGGGETATAWLITTTGRVQNLNRETVAGGIRISVPKFDQTAAILVTSDLSVIEQINQRISQTQERSAAVTVELCRHKLERVRSVDQELTQLGVGHADARPLLGQAKLQFDMAEARLKQQDYHTARQYAQVALQLARRLQRLHWERATAKLPSPLSSPYALCFQTLPAHWRLTRAIEQLDAAREPNKLPSGDFEDLDTLIAAGWRHEQKPTTDVQSAAELHPAGHQGRSSMRLAVEPTVREPATFDFHFPPVSVTSPAVTVHAGHLARISGWVKTPYPIERSQEGLVIYDSLLGKTGAVRVANASEWQRFEVWRVAPDSRTMTVSLEMHGLGEVLIDDLKITTVAVPTDGPVVSRNSDDPERPNRPSPLGAFDLRRLNPRRDRK